MSTIERAYLVCATPRSGSTLLCELLKGTGVAGRPAEYFETLRSTGFPRQPRQYFQGVPEVQTLLPEVDPGTPERQFAWDAVLRAGTTPNGVFGAKVMWSHLEDLWPRLGGRALEDVLPPVLLYSGGKDSLVLLRLGREGVPAGALPLPDPAHRHRPQLP
jgi:LPS sulfotransferase NodH